MRDQTECASSFVQMCLAQGRLLCGVLAKAEHIILTIQCPGRQGTFFGASSEGGAGPACSEKTVYEMDFLQPGASGGCQSCSGKCIAGEQRSSGSVLRGEVFVWV